MSPDKRFCIKLMDPGETGGKLLYSVTYLREEIIGESPLGLKFGDYDPYEKEVLLGDIVRKRKRSEWRPLYGERNKYPDRYNETKVRLKIPDLTDREISIVFRAYNEGVAFRYEVVTAKNLVVKEDLTGFRFLEDADSWVVQTAQGKYQRSKVSKTGEACERPYVIELASGKAVALGEAGLLDFSRMKFKNDDHGDTLLIRGVLDSEAIFLGDFTTPWRFIMVAESPSKLLQNNYLLLNLSPPSKISDKSWIKPGKVLREVTLTTVGGKACVDFAADHGISYVEFDAGWYGSEYDQKSDATLVSVDPKRSPGPLDLTEVIRYAESRNVGVILYVNQIALLKQLDTILPLYQSWGVKGLKYGFVNVGSQKATKWLHEAVKKAADYQLMIDIHDEYRPTGLSRTYPNLITQEGVRGEEESPDNTEVLKTIYTRMIAGAADHTNCFFSERVTSKMGSHASQMAKSIMIYSPWQFIYWYDRPKGSPLNLGGAGGSESVIKEVNDLSFYDKLPTYWDDTKVLEGKIGEYGTIARRSGKNWFIGSLCGSERELYLSFKFLKRGRKYTAKIFQDETPGRMFTRELVYEKKITRDSTLKLKLKRMSGAVIILEEL